MDTEWNNADMTLFAGRQGAVLNEGVYAQVRDAIVKKLGDKVHTLISPVTV